MIRTAVGTQNARLSATSGKATDGSSRRCSYNQLYKPVQQKARPKDGVLANQQVADIIANAGRDTSMPPGTYRGTMANSTGGSHQFDLHATASRSI